jgi:hypothetical protein
MSLSGRIATRDFAYICGWQHDNEDREENTPYHLPDRKPVCGGRFFFARFPNARR